VFESAARYPWVTERSYTPALAPMPAYLAMCDALGITRTVQVNASVYGFDNRITLDAIESLGQHRARGIAGVPPDVTEAALVRLHQGGMRGVRLSTHVAGYGGTDLLDAIAPKLAPLGWHVQLHMADIDELVAQEHHLMRVRAPLVFDHLGCARGRDGVGSPGFQALLRMLRGRDDCWVKISSWYRRSSTGAADYADMRPLAQALVDARPDRVVFGTNWPHPNLFSPEAVPQDGNLADVFTSWVPDAATRMQILVHNPEALYGFDPLRTDEVTV
jgi:2-pyrone-4,6-dicarboxylate lactonase